MRVVRAPSWEEIEAVAKGKEPATFRYGSNKRRVEVKPEDARIIIAVWRVSNDISRRLMERKAAASDSGYRDLLDFAQRAAAETADAHKRAA